MKTIAVFHPSSELYGADRILVNGLKALPEEVHKRVYLKFEGPLMDFIMDEVPNVEIVFVPNMPVIYRKIFTPIGILRFMKDWLAFRTFLRRENKRYKFKSAYLNTLSVSFIAPILKWLEIPNYVHVHEIIEHPKSIGKITATICARYATRVICVSQAVWDNLVKYNSKVAQRSQVIHNGIDQIHIQTKQKKEHIEFYLFGRIMPKKGQWFLIDALKHVPKEALHHCRFVLMGSVLEGNEHLLEDLKARINENGLTEYIRIKGFAPRINDAMSEADVCLVPSMMKDPFPTTVLEAMSAGRPVIATDHGGASEAIIDGETGYLISKNDPKAFAGIIEEMVSDKQRIMEMGINAMNRYNARFTLQCFNERWESFQLTNNFI